MKFFTPSHLSQQRQTNEKILARDEIFLRKERQANRSKLYQHFSNHLKIKNFVVSVLLCSGIIGALQLITTRPSQAEGSKEMTSDLSGYRPWFNSPSAGALYQGITQQLITNVYAEAGEIINVGSSGIGINSATIILKSPNGTIYTATGSGGLGIINNRTQEVAGPLPNSGGYTPYSKTVLASETGVWQITFISPGISSRGALPNTTAWTRIGNQGDGISTNGALVAWDVTVRNSGGTSIPGRAYITNLGGDMGTYYPSVLKTDFYVLTKDGYLYQVNTNTLAPLVFNFFSNNKGFTSAGNPTYKSLNGVPTVGTNVSDPTATDSGTNITNKIFLNNPLLASLPTSASHPVAGSTWLVDMPINPSISSFTYTRNVSGSGGTFNFTANTAGSYGIEIDVNNNGSFTDTVDRNIQGLTLAGINSYVWDGKDGAGKIVNHKNTLTARVATRSGEVHFPVTDAESNPNGFIITRINGIGTGDSTIYWDDTSISATIGTKNLTGATSSPSGAHPWGSNSTDQATQGGAFGNNVGIDTWTFIRSSFVFTSVLPAPNLGTCPATPYISQGINNTSIKLNSVDLQSGVLTPISTSNFAAGVNAIGFNQLDGYIYGMKAGSNNTVMKIDANGVGYDLGAITGLPLADYIAGDVDANGILYVKSLVGTSAYGIDVNSASPTYLTLVKTITGLNTISGAVPGVQDFAFHPSNGKLYTIQGSTGNVYEISWPAAGASVAATLVNRGKPTNLPTGIYGAIYFASDGSMYGYSNGTVGSNNGAIYRMTNVVGSGLPIATTLTTTATGVSSNDGARCPLAPPVLAPNTADYGDAPDGGGVTGTGSYRTLASNNGPVHEIVAGLKMGVTTPDGDDGLQQNAAANADGADEDALATLPNVPTTGTYSLTNVPVTNTTGVPATLYAWVDFNNNGSFQAGEYASATVANNATTANLTWTVPAGTVAGSTYARFRLTTQALTDNAATTAEDERSFGAASNGEVEDYQVSISAPPVATSKAKLILVKRITAIKDGVTGTVINYSGSVADLNSIDLAKYNHCNWPTATGTTGACTNTYLAGATTATAPKVKPGDEVEYTIYYLNAGGNKAKQARVCDRLNPSLVFQTQGGSGIGWAKGGSVMVPLTDIGTDADKGQLTDASVTDCNLPNNSGTEVVVVDVGDATNPLMGSTGAGTPTTSYGYIRFKAKVK